MVLRAAVLGQPIGHSQSPALHLAAYRALGLGAGYTAIELAPDEFAPFIERTKAEPGWMGLSVTMPLKDAAARCADVLTPEAAVLAVANTLVFAQTDDGAVVVTGHNTDVAGIVNALRHAGLEECAAAAILGGGGTAASAVAALARLGASEVDIYVREPSRATAAARAADAVGLPHRLRPFADAAAELSRYAAVVSTLPPHGADALASGLETMDGRTRVGQLLDVAYVPWPSALARAWTSHGGTITPGLEMLLYQGIEQVKLFTGKSVDAGVVNAMCDAVGLPRR